MSILSAIKRRQTEAYSVVHKHVTTLITNSFSTGTHNAMRVRSNYLIMTCIETSALRENWDNAPSIVHMPLGLLGFEQIKRFMLICNPEEAPFCWLQMPGADTAFLVVPPSAILGDYQPDISSEDASFLGLKQTEDAIVFNIVTIQESGEATMNLKGPIVINRETLVGKQVIPLNAPAYAVRHPLPVADQ